MKRLLLLGALALAVLVPAATAAPATTGTSTLRGTVIAKDRSHHALVVARPGGAVQMLVVRSAFTRVGIGRTILARTTTATGKLPVAVGVTIKGRAHKALVKGTIVRLAGQQAVIGAGGTFLRISLKGSSTRRQLSSSGSGPGIGDDVKVEVEIDDHGALEGGGVVVLGDASEHHDGAGELEVRGTVMSLTPSTATVAGSITVTARSLPVTCAIPAGVTLTVTVGDLVELKCDLVGDPGVWTIRIAKHEDDEGGDDDHSGPGHDGTTEVEVRGTIAAPFLPTSTSVTVTPRSGGAPVTCTITAGSLPRFAAGDAVKIECIKVGDTLKLREIEKSDDDDGDVSHDGESGHGGGGDDGDHHGDDDGGHDGSGSGGSGRG